jgi:hypothetical protein
VLYLEHSVDSLARGGPWVLGTVVRGSCRWRALSEAETETYGGTALRRLHGCIITMVKPDAQASVGSKTHGEGKPVAESGISEFFEQRFLTWSQVSSPQTSFYLLDFE